MERSIGVLLMTGLLSACVTDTTKSPVTTFSAAPQVVEVAADDIIRIVTPFTEPSVITTRDAEITIRQHVIYILPSDLGEFPMFVTDANDEASAISLTLRPELGGARQVDVASFGTIGPLTEEPEAIQPAVADDVQTCLLYTSPSPRDQRGSRMPSSA